MEPRIQFTQAADGVAIAFTTMGEGRALVIMTGWAFCHLEAEWGGRYDRLGGDSLAHTEKPGAAPR